MREKELLRLFADGDNRLLSVLKRIEAAYCNNDDEMETVMEIEPIKTVSGERKPKYSENRNHDRLSAHQSSSRRKGANMSWLADGCTGSQPKRPRFHNAPAKCRSSKSNGHHPSSRGILKDINHKGNEKDLVMVDPCRTVDLMASEPLMFSVMHSVSNHLSLLLDGRESVNSESVHDEENNIGILARALQGRRKYEQKTVAGLNPKQNGLIAFAGSDLFCLGNQTDHSLKNSVNPLIRGMLVSTKVGGGLSKNSASLVVGASSCSRLKQASSQSASVCSADVSNVLCSKQRTTESGILLDGRKNVRVDKNQNNGKWAGNIYATLQTHADPKKLLVARKAKVISRNSSLEDFICRWAVDVKIRLATLDFDSDDGWLKQDRYNRQALSHARMRTNRRKNGIVTFT